MHSNIIIGPKIPVWRNAERALFHTQIIQSYTPVFSPLVTPELTMAEPLRERTRRIFTAGLESGAIQKLTTQPTVVLDEPTGIQYIVSVKSAAAEAGRTASGAAASAGSKNGAGAPKAARRDPFETPEEVLVIERALSPTHYLQLNKFPIIDDHLLVVTTAFEPQTDVPTLADFEALATTLAAIDGFVFYNCGANSGASQPHKHFQLLPRDNLKASAGDALAHEIPMESLIETAIPSAATPALEPKQLPAPLDSAAIVVARLPDGWCDRAADVGAVLQCYEAMLSACGLPLSRDGIDHCADKAHPSHNMVMTRSWMLVAARECEPAAETGLGCNACGFGGFFLVRDAAQLEALRQRGPSRALLDLCVQRR